MFIDESMPLWIRGLVKGVSFMPCQAHPNKQLDEGTPEYGRGCYSCAALTRLFYRGKRYVISQDA